MRLGTPCARLMLGISAAVFLASPAKGADGQPLLMKGPAGGPGGRTFADLQPGGRIVEIRVRSGAYVDGIGFVYETPRGRIEGPWHGGHGGSASRFALRKGEHVVSLGVRTGRFVDSLWIRTNQGRAERWGGQGGSRSHRFEAPPGARLSGLWGRSGVYLDAVGPAFALDGSAWAVGTLDGFGPPRDEAGPPNGAGLDDGKKDSGVPYAAFPIPPHAPGTSAWLGELAARLDGVVRRLAGPTDSWRRHKAREANACGSDVNCLVWYREGAIAHVVGGGR